MSLPAPRTKQLVVPTVGTTGTLCRRGDGHPLVAGTSPVPPSPVTSPFPPPAQRYITNHVIPSYTHPHHAPTAMRERFTCQFYAYSMTPGPVPRRV